MSIATLSQSSIKDVNWINTLSVMPLKVKINVGTSNMCSKNSSPGNWHYILLVYFSR